MYTKSASVSFDQMESDIWLFSSMGEKLWTPTKNRRVLGVEQFSHSRPTSVFFFSVIAKAVRMTRLME